MNAHSAFGVFRSRALLGLVAALLCAAGSQLALAQQNLPTARLLAVYPNGAKSGTTVEVTASGTDLDEATGLLFSDPGITGAAKTTDPGPGQTGPQPIPNVFTVTIKPEVKPGVYECRVVGRYGVSNPRAFMIGTYAEVLEKESNDTLKAAQQIELNSTISGRSDRTTDQDYYKFTAKKGQRLIIESWAWRIDSRMDTTLILYSAAGPELARNRDVNRRDAMLDFTVPADGDYLVEIHDFIYAGTNEHFYRLSIGTGAYVDFIQPSAGTAGSTGQYTLYGRNLPAGQPAKDVTIDGKPLDMLKVQIQLPGGPAAQELGSASVVEPSEIGIDAIEYRLNTPQGLANPLLVGVTDLPVVVEQEPNNDPAKAPTLPVPGEYVGQFYPRGDQDWVNFEAKQGDIFWIEVISQRMGLTTDPFLLVQQVKKNEKGEVTVSDLQNVDDLQNGNIGGQVFDTTTSDPAIRFVAPAAGMYRVLVKDLYSSSRGDPRYSYRLAIRPAKPDFRLVALPRYSPSTVDNNNQTQPTVWSTNLRKGSTEIIDVLVFRRDGFDGEVQVSVEGLPSNVTCTPVYVATGQTVASLVMSAAEGAADATGAYRVVGKAKIGDADVSHAARAATLVWPGVQNPQVPPRSRLARNLTLAVSSKELAPFSLDVGAGTTLDISRAGTLQVPVKILRRGDFKGPIALSSLGLPNQFQGKKITVDPSKNEATFEITVPNNAPVGNFNVYLYGTSQYQYARNPEAAKVATDRKTAIDKMVADQAKVVADTTAAKTAAMKAVTDLTAESTKLAAAAKAAVEAAAKDAANQQLAKAKDDAAKAADDVAPKLKAAQDALAAADKAATEAAAKAKEYTAAQQSVATLATDLTNKAKPANLGVGQASQTISLKVTATPVVMTIDPASGPLKKEGKLEVPIKIVRIGKFPDAVPIKITVPGNAKGVKAADVTIAAGASEGKLVIEAAKDAAPGAYKLSVQAQPKLNGQNLNETQELSITVE